MKVWNGRAVAPPCRCGGSASPPRGNRRRQAPTQQPDHRAPVPQQGDVARDAPAGRWSAAWPWPRDRRTGRTGPGEATSPPSATSRRGGCGCRTVRGRSCRRRGRGRDVDECGQLLEALAPDPGRVQQHLEGGVPVHQGDEDDAAVVAHLPHATDDRDGGSLVPVPLTQVRDRRGGRRPGADGVGSRPAARIRSSVTAGGGTGPSGAARDRWRRRGPSRRQRPARGARRRGFALRSAEGGVADEALRRARSDGDLRQGDRVVVAEEPGSHVGSYFSFER